MHQRFDKECSKKWDFHSSYKAFLQRNVSPSDYLNSPSQLRIVKYLLKLHQKKENPCQYKKTTKKITYFFPFISIFFHLHSLVVYLSRAAVWMVKYVEDNAECVCSASSCLKVFFSTPEILKNSVWCISEHHRLRPVFVKCLRLGAVMYCRVALAVTTQLMQSSDEAWKVKSVLVSLLQLHSFASSLSCLLGVFAWRQMHTNMASAVCGQCVIQCGDSISPF